MNPSRLLLSAAALLSAALLPAQAPLDLNRTLRADYVFAGDTARQAIYVDELCTFDGWAGRRTHLDSLPLRGNGRLTLRAADSGEVLYRTGFSTLFQEWLGTEEATHTSRAFENVFLMPMPTVPADITVELDDFRGRPMTRLTHRVRPADILIRRMAATPPPHRYLHRGGSPQECIDVAIVAEGYAAADTALFYRDAQTAVESILGHEPFRHLTDRFNFVAVGLVSAESGVSVPREGTWKETALGSHFDTFYSDRYLTTLRLRRLHDRLTGIPYEHIVILAHTDTYGGGGIYNSYTLTTAGHPGFRPVVVHEFGHSFAGLADEYFYDDQYVEMYYPDAEPWEPNLTTLARFSAKWQDLLPAGTPVPTPATPDRAGLVGVYEGGGYQSRGVYRGFLDCRMKTNECAAFCPVCQRSIERLVRFFTE